MHCFSCQKGLPIFGDFFSFDVCNTANTFNTANTLNKNIRGRPLGLVWNHFIRGEEKSKGKYKARCNYCDKHWERGEPCELEGHLANHCSKAPNEVIREYLVKVLLL